MKLPQLLKIMEGSQIVEIDDLSRPVGSMMVYVGPIREIKKANPINEAQISAVCAGRDGLFIGIN